MQRKDTNPNLVGQRFRHWSVIAPGQQSHPQDAIHWLCRCKCGHEKEVKQFILRRGTSKRCRKCYKYDRNYYHEFLAHKAMIDRCFNPRNHAYRVYGAQGITVCARWRESFKNFLADMGPRPSDNHSLDRWPDGAGNYEPGNCRWATRIEQARNTKTNRYIEFNGERMILTEWAIKLGTSKNVLHNRLTAGWSIERAFTQPVIRRRIRQPKLLSLP